MKSGRTVSSTPLSSVEIIHPDHFAVLLMIAGSDTTRNATSGGRVVRMRSATMGGLKSVPVRYRLRRG
jgi:hypothetical protein